MRCKPQRPKFSIFFPSFLILALSPKVVIGDRHLFLALQYAVGIPDYKSWTGFLFKKPAPGRGGSPRGGLVL